MVSSERAFPEFPSGDAVRDARLRDLFGLAEDGDDGEHIFDELASALRITDLLSSRNINDS